MNNFYSLLQMKVDYCFDLTSLFVWVNFELKMNLID